MTNQFIQFVFIEVVVMRCIFLCVWMFGLVIPRFTSATEPLTELLQIDQIEMRSLRGSRSQISLSHALHSNSSLVNQFDPKIVEIPTLTRAVALAFLQDPKRFPWMQVEEGSLSLTPPGGEGVSLLADTVRKVQPEIEALIA